MRALASATPARPPVLVGVTGGIAAYKTVELVRGLVKDGFLPRVVMTPAAQRFVSPLTFAAVSQAPVLTDEDFWQAAGGWVEHVAAAREAAIMIVAPATANTLAKLAAGIADNLLCAVALAFRGSMLVAPAMNWAMYEHPATVENLRVLEERGVEVVAAPPGELACGETGAGRMAEPDELRLAVRRALSRSAAGTLVGKKVVVTAGGTREAIDAVRYLGNRSSGKMGRALADQAYVRGAEVVLIATQTGLNEPYDVLAVESAAEMADSVQQQIDDADVLLMAAAVADFRSRGEEQGKIERGGRESLTLDLVPTVDILAQTRTSRAYRVGFAAEAGPQLERARRKRLEKGVDLLVFNDILAEGIGIGADDNDITIIGPSREVHVPRTSKANCASAILDEVEAGLEGR